MFQLVLHAQIFLIFFKALVCYNGYQGLSWIRISSKSLFDIQSYIDSIVQILKIIVLRLRGENTIMIKIMCF